MDKKNNLEKLQLQSKLKKEDKEVRKDKQVESKIWCKCYLCQMDLSKQNFTILEEEEKVIKQEGPELSYAQLMLKLVTCEHKIRIRVPKTYLFNRGKAKLVIFSQGAQSSLEVLGYSQDERILKLSAINKDFVMEVNKRKKDEAQKNSIQKSSARGQPKVFQRTDQYEQKECAILRYEGGMMKIFNSNELLELLQKNSATSSFWKDVLYIQSCTRSKMGIGKVLLYEWTQENFQPITELEKLERFIFNEPDEVEAETYMHQIAEKIAQCMHFIYSIVIQVMKLEFIKDDQGVIWLAYIFNIHVKFPEEKEENEIQIKTAQLLPEEAREAFLKQLDEAQPVDVQTNYQKKILDQMNVYYEEMKRVVGIDQCFLEKPADNSSNEVFAKLRPLVPYSLEELLEPQMQKEANKWLKSSLPKKQLHINYIDNV